MLTIYLLCDMVLYGGDNMAVSKAAQQATRRYEAKNCDSIRVVFPKGTKDRIKATGKTVNGFIVQLVLQALDSIEKTKDE